MSEEPQKSTPTQSFLPFGLKLPVQFSLGKKNNEEELQQQNLFFGNSQQRKEESLRLLKEWARERTDIFDQNRELIEELVASVDLRARLSVDFLQIVYRFFHEKFLHEHQYSTFLLTKPQHNMKNNYMGQNLYQNIAQAVTQFEEANLAQSSKAGQFASAIEGQILNAEIFKQFSELDKQSNTLLGAVIIQQKLLQGYISQAGSKLSRLIPLFSKQERPRKKIFDDINGANLQNAILSGFTNLVFANINNQSFFQGTLLMGTQVIQNDPVEEELNRQIKESEAQRKLQEEKKELTQEQPQNSERAQDLNLEQNNEEVNVDQEQQKDQNIDEKNQSQQVETAEQSNQDSQAEQKIEKQVEIETQQIQQQQTQHSQAQNYQKQQTKNYQSNQQSQKQNQNDQDLYQLMLSYVYSQSQANKTIGVLAEKVIAYWHHVTLVEKMRAKWVSESCTIYHEQYLKAYQEIPKIPSDLVSEKDVETQYELLNLYPKEIFQQILAKYPNFKQEDLLQILTIPVSICQAPRMLVIKEFKVFHILPTQFEMNAHIVITIDRYVGCWDRIDDQNTEMIDQPNFHLPIGNMVLSKQGTAILEVMPSKHFIFVNIANDKQKCRLRFLNSDDMEEFCTIVHQ